MENPQTLFERLVSLYPEAKKTTLREMLSAKRVRVNGLVAKSLKQPLTKADKVQIGDLADAPTKALILDEGLKIVHADSDLVIIEKPTGLLTATDKNEKRPTVLKILRNYFRNQNSKLQIHIIHRLDRDASGLLVFARTNDAYHHLKEQFFNHTITRRYDVIVHGIPDKDEAKLENLLLEDERTGEVRITRDMKKGKLAILDYEILKADKKRHLTHVRCTLFTGRKHQIRVQFKAIGHPVCADRIYGTENEPPGRLALHASHLAFIHPGTKRRVTFNSPMPGVFSHLFHG